MASKKKVPVVPLFSKLEQEYAKKLLPKVLEESQGIVGIAKAKNISQYFNALRNWNKAAFKAGEFKTSPQVSDKNVFKANENRFNVLEKVTRAINENKTFDAKNKALKNVEDQFLKGELTQPTSGKGTKNLRSAFVSYQKLAEKDVLNKFGEYTPQHILDSFASNTAFKKGKTSTARAKRGVPFAESEDATKLISFMKNRFNKPSTLEELRSDILKEQNIVSLKGIQENTARVEFQDYIKQISHKLPKNVLKNYRDYAEQRGLGGVATIEKKLSIAPLAKLLEGKIQKIPTSAKVPKNVKEQIARNNLAAFEEAHAQVPELVSKIRPLDRDIFRKRATDLQNYRDLYGEKNLLSHKEIAKIYGLKKRRELDRILGKELDFKSPIDRKLFNLQKTKLEPYKKQKFSGARAHPLETQWWKDLPETNKEVFRYPVDPTLSPINAFHQRLNKLYILSKEKRLDAIKRDDRKEIFRLDTNLKKIENYIKELRLTTTLPTGETISAYPPGTSFQYKMRMLVENQKELMKKLDIAKSDVDKMYKRKGGIKDGGLISNPLTAMMNSGGFMDYGEMKPVVPPLDPGERQHLVKGGSKKGKPKDIFSTLSQYQARAQLPEVIGHTTKITEKLAAPKGDVVVKPWAVVDREGLPIKDFKTEKDAEKWLYDKKETVPENEYYESTIDYSVKPVEQIKTAPVVEETPAIMWKAPEVIANAPMEIAQGKQWLGILKKAGVSPKELDDTSLAPFLEIHEPNTKFTKAQLLKEFDDLVPKIEVLTTGKRDQNKYLTNILTKFNNVRDSISDFSGKDQAVLNNFAGILQKVNAAKTDKELSVLANQTNKIMKQSYGIDNALMSDQIPAIRQIPAPIRSIFGDMQELFKTRGAAHAFNKKPSHAGDQVLPGGVNYREYLFKYTPNQFRGDEPRYTPSHSFSFSDDVAQNTFVHTRISDRTDNFGRKLLFVEEIQSDMHQRPQKAIRKGQPSGYATRQDKIVGAEPLIQELKVLQNKIDAILAREPNHSSLPALYKKRGTLADKIEKIRLKASGTGKGGDIPEGPFQRSEDYGSFVLKYLLRLAKEGNYDGVAVSTGNIKNRRGYGSEDQQKGHYGFYDNIMQKVMKKIAKNTDLEYNRTVINDGAVNWGNVPILILKEIDKVMKGLPSFREGGLNRENFVDVVPLL